MTVLITVDGGDVVVQIFAVFACELAGLALMFIPSFMDGGHVIV